MEDELTGRIKYLIHPETNGFLTYSDENGEECSVYFNCKSGLYKTSHVVWQKGDVVTFQLMPKEDGSFIARITGFLGNEQFDELMERIRQSKTNVMLGRLKVHYDKLYFVELQSKISFFVPEPNPATLDIQPSKVYEAHYDRAYSTRCVRLLEVQYVLSMLRSRRRLKKPIMAIVRDIRPDCIEIAIPNSYVIGNVVRFNKEHWYNKEDIIYVYFVTFTSGAPAFVERDYYVECLKNQPSVGDAFHAVVEEVKDAHTYAISIPQEGLKGLLSVPTDSKVDSEESDEEPSPEQPIFQPADEVDVCYDQLSPFGDYLFVTPDVFARKHSEPDPDPDPDLESEPDSEPEPEFEEK